MRKQMQLELLTCVQAVPREKQGELAHVLNEIIALRKLLLRVKPQIRHGADSVLIRNYEEGCARYRAAISRAKELVPRMPNGEISAVLQAFELSL